MKRLGIKAYAIVAAMYFVVCATVSIMQLRDYPPSYMRSSYISA